MKKIITLCLMLAMSSAAMSQGKETQLEAKATKVSTDWAGRLSMTADQKSKTYTVVLAKMEARMKVMDAFKVSKDEAAKNTAVAKIREELKAEMKTILTSGQKYQQWEQMTSSDK